MDDLATVEESCLGKGDVVSSFLALLLLLAQQAWPIRRVDRSNLWLSSTETVTVALLASQGSACACTWLR